MTLLSVAFVLVLEWYFRLSPSYRRFLWFKRIRAFIVRQFPAQFDHLGGLVLLLGLPVVLVALFFHLGTGLAGTILNVFLGGLLLWYCLGPRDLRSQLQPYLNALERDDLKMASDHLRDILPGEQLPDTDDLGRTVTHFVLHEINIRFVAVIFWFVITGPAGALLYRLSVLYSEMLRAEPGHGHGPLLHKLRHILDWIPARLTALSFAFIGDFVRGYSALHPFWSQANVSSERLLHECGVAALALPVESHDTILEENLQALALVERALLFVLFMLIIVTLLSLLI